MTVFHFLVLVQYEVGYQYAEFPPLANSIKFPKCIGRQLGDKLKNDPDKMLTIMYIW